jgi:hypothetical protein
VIAGRHAFGHRILLSFRGFRTTRAAYSTTTLVCPSGCVPELTGHARGSRSKEEEMSIAPIVVRTVNACRLQQLGRCP